MEDRLKGMLMGALAGDALALGVHWIYDVDYLRSNYGEVRDFLSPSKNPYHSTKKKGEFTHYGDQILLLMESLAESNGFDLNHFVNKWQAFMQDYSGYKDQASLITLQNLQRGSPPDTAGSPSNDLAGAVRSVAIAYVYGEELDSFLKFSTTQTKFTHADPDVLLATRFFALLINRILKEKTPTESILELSQSSFKDTNIARWVDMALTTNASTMEAILRFGQSCHTPEAFPGVIYLIKEFELHLERAMIEAVMAGGDNATRASAVGMILGAYHGEGKIPKEWITGLANLDRIKSLMARLDEIRLMRQRH